MKKQLPLSYPPLTAYPGHADLLAILYSHPEAHDWIYSHFIQLYATQIVVDDFNEYYPTEGYAPSFFNDFDNRRLSNMMSDSVFLDREKCPHLNIFEVPNALIETYESSFVNYIKRNIDLGMYTYGYADVQKISNYGYKNVGDLTFHPVFIYGYDDDTQMFNFAEFLSGGKYVFDECAYVEVEAAFKGIKDYFLPLVKSIASIQYNDNPSFKFDISMIRDTVCEYLHPDKQKTDQFARYSTSYFSPLKWHTNAYVGVEVYDFLIDFIRIQVELNLERFDFKPYEALVEHKQMMIKRVRHLVDKGYLSPSKLAILDKYDQIRKNAESIRNAIIKRNITRDNTFAARTQELLRTTAQVEIPLLKQIFDI